MTCPVILTKAVCLSRCTLHVCVFAYSGLGSRKASCNGQLVLENIQGNTGSGTPQEEDKADTPRKEALSENEFASLWTEVVARDTPVEWLFKYMDLVCENLYFTCSQVFALHTYSSQRLELDFVVREALNEN